MPWEAQPTAFHSMSEIRLFRSSQRITGHGLNTVVDSTIHFPTAKTCSPCHGHDPTMLALFGTDGTDVNIYDDWRSSMMANSSVDPFWRAKVTHEILVNPSHSLALQDKCTTCHAPAGHYQNKLSGGNQPYTLQDLYQDTLGLDGVTCQVCHAQSPIDLGKLNSGNLHFDPDKIRVSYGPYHAMYSPPMVNFLGITPLYGAHMGESALCAGCHTLITPSADIEGNATGKTFVEQATYHEWLNSKYAEQQNKTTCQSCHFPQLVDEIIISGKYPFLTPKSPFGLHDMAGANVTMLELMKKNRTELKIKATETHFDSTLAATKRLLQNKSASIHLHPVNLHGPYLEFEVVVQNRTGHKFPTGYPSRRAWLEVQITDEAENTLLHSGAFGSDYALIDEAIVEPHHDVISENTDVQIYELVAGDITGQFTTVLERAFQPLKDNRLVPAGFKSDHPVIDTTRIIGIENDSNFNRTIFGEEGSGSDRVLYRVPNLGYTGYVSVVAKLWYQSLPPKWLDPMLTFHTPEIDGFRKMLSSSSLEPIMVDWDTLNRLVVSPIRTTTLSEEMGTFLYPNPINRSGDLHLSRTDGVDILEVEIWDSGGSSVYRGADLPRKIQGPPGLYHIRLTTKTGKKALRVVKL
jgi:hypothetical protein